MLKNKQGTVNLKFLIQKSCKFELTFALKIEFVYCKRKRSLIGSFEFLKHLVSSNHFMKISRVLMTKT